MQLLGQQSTSSVIVSFLPNRMQPQRDARTSSFTLSSPYALSASHLTGKVKGYIKDANSIDSSRKFRL